MNSHSQFPSPKIHKGQHSTPYPAQVRVTQLQNGLYTAGIAHHGAPKETGSYLGKHGIYAKIVTKYSQSLQASLLDGLAVMTDLLTGSSSLLYSETLRNHYVFKKLKYCHAQVNMNWRPAPHAQPIINCSRKKILQTKKDSYFPSQERLKSYLTGIHKLKSGKSGNW